MLLKFQILDFLIDCVSDGHSDWISGISVEILDVSVFKGVCDFPCASDCGNGKAVAHGLAQSDDIRNDAVFLEGPEGVAQSAEAGLNLVSDANSSVVSSRTVNLMLLREKKPWKSSSLVG